MQHGSVQATRELPQGLPHLVMILMVPLVMCLQRAHGKRAQPAALMDKTEIMFAAWSGANKATKNAVIQDLPNKQSAEQDYHISQVGMGLATLAYKDIMPGALSSFVLVALGLLLVFLLANDKIAFIEASGRRRGNTSDGIGRS